LLTYRERLKRKYHKYRAILILTNSLGKRDRASIDRSLENIERSPTRQLRAWAVEIDKRLRQTIAHYGAVASLEELEYFLVAGRDEVHVGDHEFLLLSKYHLSKAFRHYERALPVFPKLPLHARIGIDINSFRESTMEMEIYQLEASLFEDMAVLWNQASEGSIQAAQSDSSKLQVKCSNAILRAAAKAAFNLLEGYLKGLACDILLTRSVTDDERVELEEWDTVKSRPRFLTVRDKLLQYPKIALGAKHPPLQETSVPAMSRVLELEHALRHALIHPSPIVVPSDPSSSREAAFFELSAGRVAALCDDVIDVIQKVAETVGPDYGDVSLWLSRRDATGLFPSSTFD
jgi:hypothetical protein